MTTVTARSIDESIRARVIVIFCALVAVSGGVFAAAISLESASVFLFVGIFALAALVLPRAWIPLALVVLIPLQFYFPIAGGLNLRGAVVFVVVATLRFLFFRRMSGNLQRWYAWMIPALLFVGSAIISAGGAANRYEGFKGIYSWSTVFFAAFVVSEALRSERWLKRLILGLMAIGLAEAILGIVQSFQDVDQIIAWFSLPLADSVYQPNLLRDRLIDLSFNWILDGRVIPFGTFINAIDYAVLLAAIFFLGVALAIDSRRAVNKLFWAVIALVIGIASGMTFKGSGLIALAGGLLALTFVYARRVDARARMIGLGVIGVSILLALTLEPVAQRMLFLFQREAGLSTGVGRVAIWMQLLAALPQQWLFGFGMNNTLPLVAPLPSLRGGEFVLVTTAPESAYIAALVETGIVGFILLMAFIGVVAWRALGKAQNNATALHPGIFAALAALWFGNLTVTGLTTDQNGLLFGILIGTVFVAINEHA